MLLFMHAHVTQCWTIQFLAWSHSGNRPWAYKLHLPFSSNTGDGTSTVDQPADSQQPMYFVPRNLDAYNAMISKQQETNCTVLGLQQLQKSVTKIHLSPLCWYQTEWDDYKMIYDTGIQHTCNLIATDKGGEAWTLLLAILQTSAYLLV